MSWFLLIKNHSYNSRSKILVLYRLGVLFLTSGFIFLIFSRFLIIELMVPSEISNFFETLFGYDYVFEKLYYLKFFFYCQIFALLFTLPVYKKKLKKKFVIKSTRKIFLFCESKNFFFKKKAKTGVVMTLFIDWATH